MWWIAPLIQGLMSSSSNQTANTAASIWSAAAAKGKPKGKK